MFIRKVPLSKQNRSLKQLLKISLIFLDPNSNKHHLNNSNQFNNNSHSSSLNKSSLWQVIQFLSWMRLWRVCQFRISLKTNHSNSNQMQWLATWPIHSQRIWVECLEWTSLWAVALVHPTWWECQCRQIQWECRRIWAAVPWECNSHSVVCNNNLWVINNKWEACPNHNQILLHSLVVSTQTSSQMLLLNNNNKRQQLVVWIRWTRSVMIQCQVLKTANHNRRSKAVFHKIHSECPAVRNNKHKTTQKNLETCLL